MSTKQIATDTTAPPNLLTLEGRLAFLQYHAPDALQREEHERVNDAFQYVWNQIDDALPDGPGKTRALHACNRARMECNSAIANRGA
jgi:hypothetical protein